MRTSRRAQTTAPVAPRDARDALAAANKRAAESVYGRYATRYTVSMIDRNDSTVSYQGTVTNDLIDAVEYVTSVRKRNVYGAVMLYDRVENRHVTRDDIRKVMEACGIKCPLCSNTGLVPSESRPELVPCECAHGLAADLRNV